MTEHLIEILKFYTVCTYEKNPKDMKHYLDQKAIKGRLNTELLNFGFQLKLLKHPGVFFSPSVHHFTHFVPTHTVEKENKM